MTTIDHAFQILHQSCTPQGILASAEHHDNYNRVWARDSMMAGLAGYWQNDPIVMAAFKASVISLAKQQSRQGQLPSNIAFDPYGNIEKVSYGGLCGRVDATTWWLIGACMLGQDDTAFATSMYDTVVRAFGVLTVWEYNDRGLMYVPLGGNWADEYVTQGYTLYDQLLRLWALQEAATTYQNKTWALQAQQLRRLLSENYWLQNAPPTLPYHATAWHNAPNRPSYWACSLAPNGYDTRWDMPANALALCLGLGNKAQQTAVIQYIEAWAAAEGSWLLPVFYPVIDAKHPDWQLLSNNYAYSYKNKPYHFHNGGVWGIFLGWLARGLYNVGRNDLATQIHTDLVNALQREDPPHTFYEYIAFDTKKAGGTPHLCFTAAGVLLSSPL